MQWLQDPNHSNVENLNNVRSAANRHIRNKEKEYLEVKIDKLETNSKIENIRDLYRGIISFKKCYHPRSNIVNGEKDDLVTEFHSISARWWNHFSQPLHIHGFHDFRQTEIYIAGPLVPKFSASEF
jgi:hypothetical protein